MKKELRKEYVDLLRDYLKTGEEKDLYRASLIGKECIRDKLGPEEVVQIHFSALGDICKDQDSSKCKEIVEQSSSLLLETMMVFAANQQEIEKVLDELKKKYTEIDDAKSELEKTYSRLEKSRNELREKTAQLVQNEKMTALGELTAGVAHEINQPLNAISIVCWDLFRDIQKKQYDPDELAGSLKEVIGQVRKMADIIDHMRVFTRRVDTVQHEEFDANIPVEGIFTLLGQQLKIRGIEVTKTLEEGMVALGNPVKIEQVLMNLITNARDAVNANNKAKGMKIGIRTYPDKDAKGRPVVVYEVWDNGMGIPGDLKRKVFEPFFTRKLPGEGTGLGLSVSRQLVDDHGGTINIESRQDEGTTFKVSIPAVQFD